MSGRHEKDRANTKPGDLPAEMAERVGLTVEEQNRYRREGFGAAVRALRGTTFSRAAIAHLDSVAAARWGPDWEVDG